MGTHFGNASIKRRGIIICGIFLIPNLGNWIWIFLQVTIVLMAKLQLLPQIKHGM